MKRWIFTILLFLLLGAVVNVAVAWLCAAWPRGPFLRRDGWDFSPPPCELSWLARSGRRLEYDHFWVTRTLQSFGATETLFLEASWSGGLTGLDAWRVCSGWPMASFSGGCILCRYDPITDSIPVERYVGAFRLPRWTTPDSRKTPALLPLVPVWPGFAVNTLLYAIVLWFLIPGPFVLRRLIRIKRGRCPKCGYDLRGAIPGAGGGCPECGWNRQPEATA
jgi:hypothetical protein